MNRLKHIAAELKEHAPFTAFGAGVGMVVMAVVCLTKPDPEVSHHTFHVLHPAHMLLSSIVTAAMFRLHRRGVRSSIVVGLVGAAGICAISDILFPYVGGTLLGARMTLHVCLLKHPWLVLIPGVVGATIGALTRRPTKCPHAAHVLISTLASLFYLMAFGVVDWLPVFPLVFVVLFIAVWIPCCTSDIVFPLLFVREGRHRR
ncbi:MAG: hypothetical protein QMC89_01765 [Candidatus Hodarchaeaceae archaeon]|nr:hypothetical protein [Candidatus Hodarchaeaceae archaeon]